MDKATQNRRHGAIYGMFIGDALAMPVHWYYNRIALEQDYGWVTDYLSPRNPHPDSILWRSRYSAINSAGEILHDQARFWGKRGIHYHQFLKAGDNTLNLNISRLLMASLKELGTYDPDDFIQRYIHFMTTPGSHQDTYIEECHRNFFMNLSRGRPPERCGVTEKHIGGMSGMIPLVVFYHDQPEKALESALAHLALTHPGDKMALAGSLIAGILLDLLRGESLADALQQRWSEGRYAQFNHPYEKWRDDPDDWVVGRRFSTACYVEDALPAVIYLALKYHDAPESALIANTNLGGDNAGRGAVLGALLGASMGRSAFPERWIDGLRQAPDELPN